MNIKLPAPLEAYFVSENTHDTSAIEACFASNATVRDEGRSIKGIAAIKAWRVEAAEKYQHLVEPLAASTRDGKVVVRGVDAAAWKRLGAVCREVPGPNEDGS